VVGLDIARWTRLPSEVFVESADEDSFDCRVFFGSEGGSSQGIVRFEFDHGPNDNSESSERFFQKWKLHPKLGFDAFAALVVGPKVIAKRFDHVVGGGSKMK
jgi:hypothetical protein